MSQPLVRSSVNGLIAAMVLGLLACSERSGRLPPNRSSPDPSAEDYLAPPLPQARVILQDAFGGRHPIDVEVAATHDARTRGLMWRRNLPKGKGMLFIFPDEEPRAFWMRNTLIPLDMIFIGSNRKIRGVVKNAEPKTLTTRGVNAPSHFVLEVPGGWSDEIGLSPEGLVEMVGVDVGRPEP